jgi:transposase
MLRARELADAGYNVKDIASILGKSKRTIQRYLAVIA